MNKVGGKVTGIFTTGSINYTHLLALVGQTPNDKFYMCAETFFSHSVIKHKLHNGNQQTVI